MNRSFGSQSRLQVSPIQLCHLPHGAQALLVHHVLSRHLDGQRHSFALSNACLCLFLENVTGSIFGLLSLDQPCWNDACR